jgi:hypothetical protein
MLYYIFYIMYILYYVYIILCIYYILNYIYIMLLYIHIYMSNRKNPGNTKYVFDGHWFMEIDGNC